MRKLKKLSLIAIIFVMALTFSGCWKKDKAAQQPAPAPVVQKPLTDMELFENLFKKSKDQKNYYFEQEMEIVGLTSTAKTWIKGTKIRTEMDIMGMTQIMVGDTNDIMYTYTPSTKKATKMDMAEIKESMGEADLSEMLGELKDKAEIKKLGDETIDGKKCQVFEFKIKDVVQGKAIEGLMKFWIWEKHGLPVKFEMSMDGQAAGTAYYKNFDFGPIPDSLFELPSDAQIVDMTDLFSGLKPTDDGSAASDFDMEEFKKTIEELDFEMPEGLE